jgi:hypothetical protein
VRLRDGTMYVTFNGYWHGSAPTPLELPDGSVLLHTNGRELHPEKPETELGRSVIGIFHSQDEGTTWALLSKISA